MKQIKKTKVVDMSGDAKGVNLKINDIYSLFIPVRVVFQVKRGLESYVQKFYRKHI
jgi:hypothetical protein